MRTRIKSHCSGVESVLLNTWFYWLLSYSAPNTARIMTIANTRWMLRASPQNTSWMNEWMSKWINDWMQELQSKNQVGHSSGSLGPFLELGSWVAVHLQAPQLLLWSYTFCCCYFCFIDTLRSFLFDSLWTIESDRFSFKFQLRISSVSWASYLQPLHISTSLSIQWSW